MWKTIDAIQVEETVSTKKIADLAAGRPLVNETVHKRRVKKRGILLETMKHIVERGEGSMCDKLKAMAAANEKHETS